MIEKTYNIGVEATMDVIGGNGNRLFYATCVTVRFVPAT